MNSDGRNPKCPLSTTHVLLSVQLCSKYKIRMSNLCAQHDTVAGLKHRDVVTCMRVNAICTILQPTLFTHGHLLRVSLGTTKGTYIPIVTHNIFILCRCPPHCPPLQVRSIHVRVHVPMDHMEVAVLVFESKIATNARVHARTHANQYRIPSICSLQCPNATCVQTSAQSVPYRNHAHRCIPFGAPSKSFDQ